MPTLQEIKLDAENSMQKAVTAFNHQLSKIRTGRAHPSLLEDVIVSYYGQETKLSQVASILVEDARTLLITPWEKSMVPAIEKAILNAQLGLNPATSGMLIRIPLPALNEERRKELIRVARQEWEESRVAIRNRRRDQKSRIKELLKAKLISEDEEYRAEEEIQELTDKYIEKIDQLLAVKEVELMQV